jgi:peptidoglycan/LPS O-acetylase OafA/YrhL
MTVPPREPGNVKPSPLVRLRALDGLRGYAALAVVFCHAFITNPVYLATLTTRVAAPRWSTAWWLAHPPLNLIWAGQQAVLIFFVLSGLVVSLPFVKGNTGWLGYYPRRFVRLYLPTWAAVGLAVVIAEIVRRHAVPGESIWVAYHTNPHWSGLQRDVILVTGPDLLNGPLWSLRWEVLFSALLPVYVLLARTIPRASVPKILLMLVLIGIGAQTHHASLMYLPAFGSGAALAGDLDGVRRLSEWLRGRRLAVLALIVGAGVLLDAHTFLLFGGGAPSDPKVIAYTTGTAAGATLAVLLAMLGSPVKAACESRVGQWLGRQSFSLYLVHEPIIVSVAILFGGATPIIVILAVSLPIALATSWVFQRLVEGPAHTLSQTVGRAVSEWAERRRPAAARA